MSGVVSWGIGSSDAGRIGAVTGVSFGGFG